jgi:SPP1 family predicted phage head-tail adaptor
MNIGSMSKRVTIRSKTQISDGAGGWKDSWVEVATVWASVEPLSGNEFFKAQQLQYSISHKVTIRYKAGITPKMDILYHGREFDIQNVIDPKERHEQLVLLCQERLS